MSKRFIIQDKDVTIKENTLKITGESVNHIFALRHNVGEEITVNEYRVVITNITKGCIETKIQSLIQKTGEPKVNITLIQGYLKSDKMEWIVQKSVELGAKEIIGVQMRNSVVKLESKDILKKQDRLKKISTEAIEQCGRTDDVKVSVLKDISEIKLNKFDKIYICHEKCDYPLKEIVNCESGENIAVVIGPEGGLDDKDIQKFSANNTVIVSLGERILRAETASVYMLSIIDFLTK